MASGIYRILNCENGMIYVGRALNFEKRWKNHRVELRLDRHCNPYLQSAWSKYGEQAFEFLIIEECTIENIIAREQHWLDETQCYDREIGYNLVKGSEGLLGHKASPETRALLSAMRKGKPRSEETKARMREAWKLRKPVSDKAKENMRQAQLGKKQSEETKAKRAKALIGNTNNKGGSMSDEHKAAISAAKLGHITSEETKFKIAESNKGQKRSAETRFRQSEAAKRRWAKMAVDKPT